MHDIGEEGNRAGVMEFLQRDQCAKMLAIRFDDIAPGRASATMTVRADMVNGHGLCHGGLIFTLADTVFAVACNGRGRRAVAQFCSIAFLRPVEVGDQLRAVGRETILAGQRGIYDITVTCGEEVIAAFRGHARSVDGPAP